MAFRAPFQTRPGAAVMPSPIPISQFPLFAEGDVLITITSARRYKLHSNVLSHSSATFATILTPEAAAKLTRNAERRGVTTRYRLTLAMNPFAGQPSQADHILKRDVLDDRGNPIAATTPIAEGGHHGLPAPGFVQAWDMMLGSFYGRPIDIGNFDEHGIVSILQVATELLKVADSLGCIEMTTKPIEAALLSNNQVLQRSISQAPASWLDFSYRSRSRPIFREALIHAAGKYSTPEIQEALREDYLPASVKTLLMTKGEMLIAASKRVQSQILSYYPQALTREKTIGRADRDNISRNSYANDIYIWMSLVVFRHWCTQMMNNDKTHHAEDIGFTYFSVISQGHASYLDKSVLAQFHNHFPMSTKGEGVLENKVNQLKEHCKTFVTDILKNNSMLDTRQYLIQHFTCTCVTSEDFPWDRDYEAPLPNTAPEEELTDPFEDPAPDFGDFGEDEFADILDFRPGGPFMMEDFSTPAFI